MKIDKEFEPLVINNVMIFGLSGIGKTSFINSTLTLESEYVINEDNGGSKTRYNESEQVTIKYTSFPMKSSKIKIFDLWGWSGKDDKIITTELFRKLIKGQVQENCNMNDIKYTNNYQNKIDCVVFVFDNNVIKGEYIQHIKVFYDIAKEGKFFFNNKKKIYQHTIS
jgi:GTPase SAR1 family protein